MNPLTLVKRIQNINKKEAALGISEEASWHAKYKDSAYVYIGGIPFDLTEGDLLAVFSQYGEIVDVNLIRDKGTGKSKGFAFLAYEDQRSTNLAVDNLNGAQILGRTVRVDHVTKYKKLEEEDEETRQQKRNERGVCRAFQKGECNRGDSCKFSHDEQRAANTGWGADEDRQSRWDHDRFDGSVKDGRTGQSSLPSKSAFRRGDRKNNEDDSHGSRLKGKGMDQERSYERVKLSENDGERRVADRLLDRKEDVTKNKSNRNSRNTDDRSSFREEPDSRYDKRVKKYDTEAYHRETRSHRERENSPVGEHRRHRRNE